MIRLCIGLVLGFFIASLSGCDPEPGPSCAQNVGDNAVVTPATSCLALSSTSCQGVTTDTTEIDNHCSQTLTLDLAGPDGNSVVAAGSHTFLFSRDIPDGGVATNGPTERATLSGSLGDTPLTIAFDLPSGQ